MRFYSATDIGRIRKVNQDYVFASASPIGHLPNLFLVADGMGGHNAGDYASSFAVKVIVDTIARDWDYTPVKVIRHAIETANEELRIQAARNPMLKGMGTTIVAMTLVDHCAYIANVGDSRLYRIDSRIHQVTRDHSLVEEMVRLGEISPADARNHPDKNIITRALGAEERVNIDFFEEHLTESSMILMCSDGLSNMVTDHEMEEIILTPQSEISTRGEALVTRANYNGGKDNIAVVLVEPFTNEVDKC